MRTYDTAKMLRILQKHPTLTAKTDEADIDGLPWVGWCRMRARMVGDRGNHVLIEHYNTVEKAWVSTVGIPLRDDWRICG